MGVQRSLPGHMFIRELFLCLVAQMVKSSACNARDLGSIPGSGRSPGEGNDNPLQCLENPMDRGAWQAAVHGVSRVGHDIVTKPPARHCFSFI